MPSFLVESYAPAGSRVEELELQASHAAEELSAEGTPVQYVRAIFVPEDQTCFFLFEAASSELAGEASRRAGVAYDRIVAYQGGRE